jgi:hypothetical protein
MNSNNSNRPRNVPTLRLHWDFLPPGDAHNRCDASAANWKRPQKNLVRDFCVLTSVGHLAFACSEMKNSYIIEAEYMDFPDPLECLIDEPWMREAFHFDYGVPDEAVKTCKHQCKNKRTCKHDCCKKDRLLPHVIVTIQDRDKSHVFFCFFVFVFFVFFCFCLFVYLFICVPSFFKSISTTEHSLWLDTEVRARDDLDSLDEDSFWDSDNRRRYHAVSLSRISQLNVDDEEIYYYDDLSAIDDAENNHDGDFIDY